jgi:hypothetical protein
VTPEEYFSVARADAEPAAASAEPEVAFEIVDDDEEDTMPRHARPDARWTPPAAARSVPAGPRGNLSTYVPMPRPFPPAAPAAPTGYVPRMAPATPASVPSSLPSSLPHYVTPRPVREPRVELPPIQTEWARRAFTGPVGADRVRGMCSGCGTTLSVARAPRPLRTACPVCGRTRVLS